MTSYGISVDGNKKLHDSCRVDLEGKGTYDRVIAAVHKHETTYGLMPSTKMTLAPENIIYLYDATIGLISEGYTEISLNCVFEDVWNLELAKIYYNQLKCVADYFIDNNLYNKIYYRLFSESAYHPMDENDNNNWCGGVSDTNLSLDPEGNLYPCIRYMASSLNGKQKPLIIGDLSNGYNSLDIHHENIKLLSNITRRSQSTDECFYCPIAAGCAWCSGYNYEVFGTPNKRATFICCMHKAEALANVYYWNKLYQYLGIDKVFEMHIPKEWALEIIDEDEYNYLYELSHKN
jgi:radical SAM peptide maturase (CXXX-repeat target family)